VEPEVDVDYDSDDDWGVEAPAEANRNTRGKLVEEKECYTQEDEYNEMGENLTFKISRDSKTISPETQYFFRDHMDFSDPYPDVTQEEANRILPLAKHGDGLDDFLEAVIEHPSKYSYAVLEADVPDSKREAVPIKHRGRNYPPPEFVTKYKGFVFAEGMRHQFIDNQLADFSNQKHRDHVAAFMSDFFNVKPEDVHPASTTSAFIGFTSPRIARTAFRQKHRTVLPNPIQMHQYQPPSDQDDQTTHETSNHNLPEGLQEANPEHLLVLTNLPPNSSPSFIINLFSAQGDVFRELKPENVHVSSPTTAFLVLPYPSLVQSTLTSQPLQNKLHNVSKSIIKIFACQRNQVFDCYTGWTNSTRVTKKGHSLIVEGDLPDRDFLLSHIDVIVVKDLDVKNTSKEQLSKLLQPYCEEYRDVHGSIRFVTCSKGFPTGVAYVGFDLHGESDKVLHAYTEGFSLGEGSRIHRLHERKIPDGSRNAPRPNRSEEELLDSLKNWEKHADPQALEFLGEHGIDKSHLDDVFVHVRYKNRYFGSMDQASKHERLDPDKEIGDEYAHFVKEYIQSLTECIATNEDPGFLAPLLFEKGDDVDIAVIDAHLKKKKRQKPIPRMI